MQQTKIEKISTLSCMLNPLQQILLQKGSYFVCNQI
jgi:hypothetical protein